MKGFSDNLTVRRKRMTATAVTTLSCATLMESLLGPPFLVTCMTLSPVLHAQSILTLAGGHTGDGRPATLAGLRYREGITVDTSGNLYIADGSNYRIRKVAAGSGIISTVAGNGTRGYSGDGGPATAAGLDYPEDVAVDTWGNLFIPAGSRVFKVDTVTGIISTVAGNGRFDSSGDGGPATAASIAYPRGVTVDASGNLYIGDWSEDNIRTGIITTVGFRSGRETLSRPMGLAVDASVGRVYFADDGNNRIGIVTDRGGIAWVAGTGSYTSSGDGGPATAAGIPHPYGVAVDAFRNLYIASNGRVRKVDANTRIITTVTGGGQELGDGGPATAAGLDPVGLAVDLSGNLYIADAASDRVRVVFACVTANPPNLSSPADGSSGVTTSPRLTWTAVSGAFRYDVVLDTVNPPVKVAAQDVTTLSFSPANLEPLTTYYWQVIAKGDPFCTLPSNASSGIRSFTTSSGCRRPAGFEGASP